MLVASAPRAGRASVCLGEGGHTQDSCPSLRLEINSGKTESCSVHSLDQRIKRNNGVSTLTERQNFSLQSLSLPPMESGKSYLQNILLSMNDFMSCLCVTKSVKCVPC